MTLGSMVALAALLVIDPPPKTESLKTEPVAPAKGKEAPPVPVAEPKSSPAKAEAKPVLRLRRGSSKEREKATKSEEEKAPEVPERPIPKPEAKPKPSDLDAKLLDELGRDLEANLDEEPDPLLRAGRRMRTVEERLAQRRTDIETIELQKKIVADLEELLKPRSNPNNNDQNKKQQQKKKQQKQPMRPGNQPMQRQIVEQQQQQQQTGRRPAQIAGGPRRGSEDRSNDPLKKDIWGHLSAMEREEMSQYAKEVFLESYRDLLEQYYTTISKKSRTTKE